MAPPMIPALGEAETEESYELKEKLNLRSQ